MRSRTAATSVWALIACAAAGALFPAAITAQAWLPPQGEAWFSLGYGNVYSTKHYLGDTATPGDNVEVDYGHIRSQSVGMQLGYGVTDRFALSLGLPLIISKFYGPGVGHNASNIAPDQQHIDADHLYHDTFQDFTVGARYQILLRPVALSVFAGAVIPSHSYTYFAHSAAGRDLHEYPLGLSFGTVLDRILPGSYVEASYSYSFVERVLGIYHDRSNFFAEIGYFLTPSLTIRGVGMGLYTHGGVILKNSDEPLPKETRIHHDQITHDTSMSLGGGLSYVLNGSTEVYVAYLHQVMGRGGHKIDQSLSFGVSWNFSPQQLVRRYLPPKSETSAIGAP